MRRSHFPLTALRSFEVAGRLKSFTHAAEELRISQAAVSRQVRELERFLGKPLFERCHRRVSLTSSGEEILAVLTASFDEIGSVLNRVRATVVTNTLLISVEPSFGSGWLVRNLASFCAERPDIDLVLDSTPSLVEFRTAGATIAIRHSDDTPYWSRVDRRHLLSVNMIPVAAPDLLRKQNWVAKAEDLLRYPLLHERNRDLWQRWFKAAGSIATVQRGTVYTDGGLVLDAARQGEGVALVDEYFIRDDLKEGKLLQVLDTSIPHGSYWLVARDLTDLPEATLAFVRWLEQRVRTGT